MRFCRPSPAVAGEASCSPRRSFARPSQGQMHSVAIERPMPSTVVSAWCSTNRAWAASKAMYGASRKKLSATSCCARRSELRDRVREPEKRHSDDDAGEAFDRAVESVARGARSSPRANRRSWWPPPRSRATRARRWRVFARAWAPRNQSLPPSCEPTTIGGSDFGTEFGSPRGPRGQLGRCGRGSSRRRRGGLDEDAVLPLPVELAVAALDADFFESGGAVRGSARFVVGEHPAGELVQPVSF